MKEKIEDLASLKAYLSAGGIADYVLFFGHRAKRGAAVDKACLSQWYPAGFLLEGIQYKTAEQYMMASKARLFGDFSAMNAILLSSTPAEAKSLGRKVKGYDEATWVENRISIVNEGNYAKFSQNLDLKDYLLGTGSSILVESSPKDRIWGSGIGADDADAQNPFAWTGLNLLGFSLMHVRRMLEMKSEDVSAISTVKLVLEYSGLGASEWESLANFDVELRDGSWDGIDWNSIDLATLKNKTKNYGRKLSCQMGKLLMFRCLLTIRLDIR